MRRGELKRCNEKLQESLKGLTANVKEEQECYSKIITHMKQSIVADEEAIEKLSQQTNLLEEMMA